MERNAELLRKVADKIAAFPELYDQGCWAEEDACGTTACIAGHALLESGKYRERVDDWGSVFFFNKEGVAVPPAEEAEALLGLSKGEATRLFSMGWQPTGEGLLSERVQKALYAIANGADIEDVSVGVEW